MNAEDFEGAVDSIDALARDFRRSPSRDAALDLEMRLTKLKMATGPYNFDQLYAYVRLELDVQRYLNSLEDGPDVESMKIDSLEDLTR
nr:MAG TPA: hypothetical protein [Caudoviricetes sp.]